MIFGSCPHCDALLMVSLADRALPCFERTTCAECDGVVWVKHSRALPETFTDEEFHTAHELDGKTVKEKANAR